jgi:hypothetical protein
MNKEDTIKILRFLTATYPTVRVEDPKATVEAWQEILADVDFETAYEATKKIIREQEIPAFPAVGRIYAAAKQIQAQRQPKEKPWYMED